jgi:hypothetical protein
MVAARDKGFRPEIVIQLNYQPAKEIKLEIR